MAEATVLAGRYAFERELGRGVSGRVIAARDLLAEGRLVALKIVSPSEGARLRWEFELLHRVASPCLVRVQELLSVDAPVGSPYRLERGASVLVESYAEGAPAERALEALDGEARLVAVLEVGSAVARGLAAVHAAGLVHGDVKPDNIVVSDAPARAVLVDLGLARPPGLSGRVTGTPAFLAPEAWQGEQSVASDLYALGATLHHLLGGPSPTGASRSASARALVSRALEHPRRVDALDASVPPAVRRLLATLLDREPSRRPTSAREVAARLARLVEELSPGQRAAQDLDDVATPRERAMALDALALVGRDGPLAALVEALGTGGVIHLIGPSGAGKTRLAREAVRAVQAARASASTPAPTLLHARGTVPDGRIDHDAIVLVEDARPGAARDARAAIRAAAIEGHGLTVVLEGMENETRGGADPDEDEDVQAADATARGATEATGPTTPATTPRARTRATTPGTAREVTIALSPLASPDVSTLLAHALGGAPTTRLVDAAVEVSGGLPGRLVRLLAEAFASGTDPSRPETLRALGRTLDTAPFVIDALPEEARALAELLAVVGGEADASLAVRHLGEGAVADGLRALCREGLVTLGASGRARLRRDALTALFSNVGGEARRALADEVALAEEPEARAFIALARDDTAEAERALLDAIAHRRARGDAEGALELVELTTEVGLVPSAAITRARADALRARGRYEEALAALSDASDAASSSLAAEVARLAGRADVAAERAEAALGRGDRTAEALASVVLARLALDAGDFERALAESEVAIAADPDAPRVQARAREVAALARLYRGERDAALSDVLRALDAADEAGDRATLARLHAVHAMIALSEGQVAEAARRYVRAFEIADAAGELHASAAFLLNVGVARLDAGDLGPAGAALAEGARRLARLGRDADLARALYNLGLSAVLAGDDDLARLSIRHGREAAERAGDRAAAAFATTLAAEMAVREGALKRARERVEEAGALAEGASPKIASVVHARRALVLTTVDDRAGADAALAAAASASEETGDEVAAAEVAIARARLCLARSEPAAARAAAERARAHASRAGTFETELRATLALADALEAVGEGEASKRELAAARALLDRAAATLDLPARARLREVPSYQRALVVTPRTETGARGSDDGERFRRLVRYARRLTAERRVSRLYDEVLDAALDLSGAERGFLVLRDEHGILRVKAQRGLGRKEIADPSHAFSRSIAARAIDSATAVNTVDALADERLDGAASVHALALRSVCAVPLRRRGAVEGALYLDDRLRPGAFGAEDVAVLEDLAELASIALDGAELLRAERRAARRAERAEKKLGKIVEAQAIEISSFKKSAGPLATAYGIVAESDAMRRTLELAERVASSDVAVLVVGESGTGKELLARAIHRMSPRHGAAFVSENCGAIPEPLLESALFGHVRGAFTGADRARVGLFEAANGGTLFLDEIGEMSAAMQAKLLRAVQDGEVRAVGGERARRVDVRVVAATHRDLARLIEDGAFREDLYYRLAVVTIEVPPLRTRPEDVPALVSHFLGKHKKGRAVRIEQAALDRLSSYAWPGNVRQLENELQRALVLADDVIDASHLSPVVRGDEDDEPVDELDMKGQQRLLEKRLIKRALDRAKGNQTRAAQLLGLSRYGLQKMLKRLELG